MPDLADSHSASRYTAEAGDRYHVSRHEVSDAVWQRIATDRAEKFGKYVHPGDTVVELGVGPGWNLVNLRCERKIGVDVSTAYAADMPRLGIEFFEQSSMLADGCADVVLSHHMLEHVSHPTDVLGEARRLLAPGGSLLLFVPYEFRRVHRRFRADEPNHHLFSWNVQTLGALVSDAGFAVRHGHVQRFGFDRFSARCAERLHLGGRGQRLIRAAMLVAYPIREVVIIASPAPTPNVER